MEVGQRHKGEIKININPKTLFVDSWYYFNAWFGACIGSQGIKTEPRFGYVGSLVSPLFDYGVELSDKWSAGTTYVGRNKEWNRL